MSDALIDPERSARFGEPIPISSERSRLRREGIEHIDVFGQLVVPCNSSFDPAPRRDGWVPRFVSVNLGARPQKWITYRRPGA